MAVRAPSHMAVGWARRSSVVSIQPMSPCRPASTKYASRSPALHGSEAEAKRHTSKPRTEARSRMKMRGSRAMSPAFLAPKPAKVGSEVEVGVPGRGVHAGEAVGQQRPEAGARLQLHVPGLQAGPVGPGDLAEIVEHRQVGGGHDVGLAEPPARQPVA